MLLSLILILWECKHFFRGQFYLINVLNNDIKLTIINSIMFKLLLTVFKIRKGIICTLLYVLLVSMFIFLIMVFISTVEA